MAKKKLQTFVLMHQAFVADIFLLYNFIVMFSLQVIISVITTALYN